METNSIPSLGIFLTQDQDNDYFFKIVQEMFECFKYKSIKDLKKSHIQKYLEQGMETFHLDQPELLHLIKDFYDFAIDNSDELELNTFGNMDFPRFIIVYINAKSIPYNKFSSYVISLDTIDSIREDIKNFEIKSKERMSSSLFNYFKKNDVFKLQMIKTHY